MRKLGMIIGCIFLTVFLAGVFFIGGRTLMAFVFQNDKMDLTTIGQVLEQEELYENEEKESGLKVQEGERTNVLLLGIDARRGETISRTDTMILVSIDPELKQALFISIPRDTRVVLRGSKNQKINAANVYGGIDLARETVEKLLNTEVDYYAKANFEGFGKIVDILGGININVEQRMYKPSEDIDLYPGEQLLDGYGALAYVRFRDYIMGDIDRTSHQQRMLNALAEKLTEPATILKLPKMLEAILDSVETDIPMEKLVQMASWAPLFNADELVSQTVPGCFLDIRDSAGTLMDSFWEADSSIASHLIEDLYKGKTYPMITNANGKLETVGGGSSSANTTSPAQQTSSTTTTSTAGKTDKNTSNSKDSTTESGHSKPEQKNETIPQEAPSDEPFTSEENSEVETVSPDIVSTEETAAIPEINVPMPEVSEPQTPAATTVPETTVSTTPEPEEEMEVEIDPSYLMNVTSSEPLAEENTP